MSVRQPNLRTKSRKLLRERTTMTEVPGPPVDTTQSGTPDFNNPELHIESKEWLDPPNSPLPVDKNGMISSPRPFFLENFRLTATPFQWNRYLLLGYYSHEDGSKFDIEWNRKPEDWLHRHKIVWYNFMYFVDRNTDIPLTLQAWAIQVSQPFLFKHDPSFLKISTSTSTWKSIIDTGMEVDDPGDWKTVGLKQRSEKKNVTLHEPETRIRPPPVTGGSKTSSSSMSVLAPLKPAGILKKNVKHPSSTSSVTSTTSLQHAARHTPAEPVQQEILPTPVDDTSTGMETEQGAEESIYTDTSAKYPDSTATGNRVFSHDGTQRITIRWKPTSSLSHENQPDEWYDAAATMLTELFGSDEGALYEWGSTTLSHSKKMAMLTKDNLPAFMSPKVTYIRTTKTHIFGIRFGFSTKTPVKWLTRAETKEAMRKHKVWATVSNSSTTSGNLVVAGYVLMKAPNLTHRIRYMKSLRQKMPENTPFFDIIHLKRTPDDKIIHHLAVQCGENHVEPLSKALSEILKGKGSALYLPRLTLGNLTAEQKTKYFLVHDNYMKSLRMIPMAPMIANVDQERTEHMDNGDPIIRSTREWATNLILPSTGMYARCDVVNGGKDQVATLLVPKHNYAETLLEYAKYKLRLNPMVQREARFREHITGFPDVIEVDTSVQEALDCLESLSAEEVWQRAPSAVRQASTKGKKVKQGEQHKNVATPLKPPAMTRAVSVTSNLSESSSESDSESIPPKPSEKIKKSPTHIKANRNPQEDRSTKTATSSVTSQRDKLYRELEEKLANVQTQRETDMQETRSRLSAIDDQLQHLHRLDDLETKALKSMQYHVTTNTALTEVQSQMSEMMGMIRDLAAQSRIPLQQNRNMEHSKRSSQHREHPPSTTETSSSLPDPISHDLQEAAHGNIYAGRPGTQSSASSSSGSQHAKPPPKKNLKRSMPDAMEQLTLASEHDDDGGSETTFGSSPLQDQNLPNIHPPPHLLMEVEDDSLEFPALPDLDDQYKLTDEEFNAPYNPDGGDKG